MKSREHATGAEQCWDWERGLDPPRLGLAFLPGRCEANLTGRHLLFSGPQGPFPVGTPPSASVAPGTGRQVRGRAGHRASKGQF